MYPYNIDCLEIETNGSYCKAVTGIIVITVALIIGSSILGAWDVAQNGFQQEDFELPFIPENKYSEESSSEIKNSVDLSQEIMMSSENSEDSFLGAALCGSSDVSVPEKGGPFGPYDTAPGKMVIADQVLPIDPLPLKIDNNYLDDYYIIVGTLGGYTFVDGCIKVMQCKEIEYPEMWKHIVGYIDISLSTVRQEWFDNNPTEHGWVYHNLTFSVSGHSIILDANDPPQDSELGDFSVWFDGYSDLDKFVHLKVSTEWEGCRLPEQHFVVILAHKAMSQNKIPNSR